MNQQTKTHLHNKKEPKLAFLWPADTEVFTA